jgi:hypothetical protein
MCLFSPSQSSCSYTDIEIQALTHPHADLPSDMQMFAQAIIDKRLILQTTPVVMEPSQKLWKLTPSWKMYVLGSEQNQMVINLHLIVQSLLMACGLRLCTTVKLEVLDFLAPSK